MNFKLLNAGLRRTRIAGMGGVTVAHGESGCQCPIEQAWVYRRIIFYLLLLAHLPAGVVAQPTANFTAPDVVCTSQAVFPTNSTTGASSLFWDFNQGDLLLNPTAQNFGNFGGNIPYGIETAFDGTSWYGFIVSRGDGALIRLEFGNSLNNTPVAVTLPNVAGGISPNDIEIVFVDNEWFGFVSGANQRVTRFDFGPSLTSTPTITPLVTGASSGDSGIDVVENEGVVFVSYSIGTPSQVGMLRLTHPRTVPTIADQALHSVGGGALFIGDVKLVNEQGAWFAYTVSYSGGNKLLRLSFGSDFLAAPVVSDIGSTVLATVSPFGIDVVQDGGVYMAFVSTDQGNLFRFNLGSDLSLLPLESTDLGKLGVLANSLKVKFQKENSRWFAFAMSWASSAAYRIFFPDASTPVTPLLSTSGAPSFSFNAPGSYAISLLARAGAAQNEQHRTISVTAAVSPEIDFDLDGVCRSAPIGFSLTTNQQLVSTTWDFGDGTTSNDSDPTHTYAASGIYTVNLEVIATNTCVNNRQQTVVIVERPVANFELPEGPLFCTNQLYSVTNTTQFSPALEPTWQWIVNGLLVGGTQNLATPFVTAGDQTITLLASVPGCSDLCTRTVPNVRVGPSPAFEFSTACEGSPITFTNSTAGEVASYEWDFGDGNLSVSTTGVHTYSGIGKYVVTLRATNAVGCQNTASKDITVRSKPAPNFSLSLPPFSCSGTPAQFSDLTPAPTDSNVASWLWNFGAPPGATSTERNPSFTFAQPGDYNVSLAVATDQGCTDTVQKTVTILPSPAIDFMHTPACRNQATQFTSNPNAPIKSYQWTIGASSYTIANPTHVFAAPGSTSVQLRVVAQNDCVATASKTILVPAELTPNFSIANACAGQVVTFTNATVAANDPVQAVQWLVNNSNVQGQSAITQFATAGTYPVRMQVTAQSGCNYVLNRNITINPSPRAGFTLSDDAGPAPFSVSFTNTSQGATAYVWRFNDGLGGTSTSTNPQFTFQALGTYGVDLIAFNHFNCVDQTSQQLRVIVPLPDLEMLGYQLIQDPVTKLLTSQIDIKNNSNYTIREAPVLLNLGVGIAFREVVREEWRPGDVKTVSLQNQLLAAQPVTFACAELALPNDLQPGNNKICIAVSEPTVWLTAYPNPADRFLTVPLISGNRGIVSIRLINATGAVAYEKTVDQKTEGLTEWTLAVDNLAPGLYTLVVRSPDGENISQVLITR